ARSPSALGRLQAVGLPQVAHGTEDRLLYRHGVLAGWSPARVVYNPRSVSRGKALAIRALGPYGGSAPGYRLTTFLIDGESSLDAGCLTDALPLAAQRRVRRIVLTHAHFDHIVSLPMLVENL